MRLAFLAAAAVSAIALTACNPPATEAPADPAASPEPTAPVEPAAPPEPKINGIDLNEPLRGVGTEPFWSIEVNKDTLKFTGADLPERTTPNSGVTMSSAAEGVFSGTTEDGVALKITLTSGPCSDGMSDRTYPLTAKVQVADATYNGCAATAAALDRARNQESGEIR